MDDFRWSWNYGIWFASSCWSSSCSSKKLVIDIAGEASVLMTMQEMSTAVQYNLPIKIFILNNEYMGMVRQWQELLHDKNYSESYTAALPDFVKMAKLMDVWALEPKLRKN